MAQARLLVGAANSMPAVRHVTLSDLMSALRAGWNDFLAMPSHALFLCVVYPVLGVFLIAGSLGDSLWEMAFPTVAGFALVGPIAAIGLYELSRRREASLDTSSSHVLDILYSPSLPAIIALGVLLMAIFLIWLAVAYSIYVANFGYVSPSSPTAFLHQVFETRAGWTLIIVGTGTGALFAALVLTISVISFPLLLDRDVGAAGAIATSVRVVAENPVTMMMWGVIVAGLLFLGSVPMFLGLTVVMPVLGHATWHLYRRAVEPAAVPRSVPVRRPQRPQRAAADFPAALFPTWR